jgi:hypothetical protein
VGGGPPIDAGAGAGCTGTLGQVDFTWALCSCTNFDISAPLTTDGYNSTLGPPDGGLGGNVGVDETTTNWSSRASIGGDFRSAGTPSIGVSGPASTIRGNLWLEGSMNGGGLTVDQNAHVVGSLTNATVLGSRSNPGSVPAPCDCRTQDLVPVVAIVAAHRPPSNDNTSIGLSSTVVASKPAAMRIDLPCGNYYFTQIDASNALTIWAHGHTAIYVDGDVTSSAPLTFGVDPTGTLDIFIAGTISTSQTLTIGSPNYPALVRTYVGGTAPLNFSQNVNIGSEFYAANSSLLSWSASSAIYGAVFAGSFKASHDTVIHYDQAVLQAGQQCGQVPLDAGVGCSSCRDCQNQACVGGSCGPCTQDSDCCEPLFCNIQSGQCQGR